MGRTQGTQDLGARTDRNSPRDYIEIGAAFVILVGIVLALDRFDLLPQHLSLSDEMSYGLVFGIGLVASVSSCMAVTGGLLVAVSAKYNDVTGNLTSVQRLRPTSISTRVGLCRTRYSAVPSGHSGQRSRSPPGSTAF
jgi:hypothetical protein